MLQLIRLGRDYNKGRIPTINHIITNFFKLETTRGNQILENGIFRSLDLISCALFPCLDDAILGLISCDVVFIGNFQQRKKKKKKKEKGIQSIL